MLNWLLKLVGEVRVLTESLLEEGSNLSLKVRLTAESDLSTFISSNQCEGRLAILVACEAQTMSDHHLLNEVVLSVLNDSQSHDVEESVAIGVGHHRVGSCRANKSLKAITVEFGSCNVNRRLAVAITHERTRIAVFKQGIDHEGIAAQNGLV